MENNKRMSFSSGVMPIPNSFMIVRFVFFSFISYLNLLTFIFTLVHAVTVSHTGTATPSAAVFVLVNSCLLFLFLVMACLQMVFTRIRTAIIAVECVWTAVMSILLLAAAVNATFLGPPVFCEARVIGFVNVCATSYLLLPVTWLLAVTVNAYFFVLVIVSAKHAYIHDGIWTSTVYDVSWFSTSPENVAAPAVPPKSLMLASKHQATSNQADRSMWEEDENRDAMSTYRAVLKHFSRIGSPVPENKNDAARAAPPPVREVAQASLANTEKPRRGIDPPFATVPRSRQGSPIPSSSLPRGSGRPGPSQVGEICTGLDRFSAEHDDPDQPIPLPRLSKWIRADEGASATVHTMPVPVSGRRY